MNEQFKVTSAEKEPESLSSIDEYKEIEEKLDNPDPKQSFYEAEKISELKEKQDILKEEIIEDHLSEQSEEYRDLKKKLDDGDYIKDSSDSYTKDQTRLSELRKSLYEKSLKDSNPEYKKLKEKLDDADYVKDNTDVYRKDLQKLKRLEKGLNNSLVDNIVSSKLEPKKETLNGGEQAKLNTESSNVPSSIEITEDKKVEQETTTEEKKTEEIIELTDIVSDEEMDHYRKMSSKELTGQHKELKQALEESGSELTNKEANEIKKAIGIIEKIEEEVGLEVESNQELKESWSNLEDTRNEYIKLHQSYLQEGVLSGVRSALGISSNREMSSELIEAKEKYDLAKKTYAKNEQTVSLEKIDDNLSDDEKEKQKEQINNKIFNIVVLDEQEYLLDAQAESHPPKERGIFMKAYDRWTSLSKTQRLVYSTVMVAGVAGYATLAVPVTASAAALGMGGVAGKKLLRGSFGMLFSGLAGKVFDKQISGKKEEIKQTADTSVETVRQEFDLDNLEKIENQYKDTIEQERKGSRNILIRKALVMGGAGMTSAMGIGMADNALAGTSVVNNTEGAIKPSVEDNPILEGGTPKETMDALIEKESLPSNLDMSDWSEKKVANFNYLEGWREKWGAGEIISNKELGDAAGSSRQDKIIELLEKKVKTNKLHEVAKEIAKEQGTYRVYTDENGLTQEEYSTKGLKWNYKEKTWVKDKVNVTNSASLSDNSAVNGLNTTDNVEDINDLGNDKVIKGTKDISDADVGAKTEFTHESEVAGGEILTKAQAVEFVETAQKGDSVWKMAENQLEKHYGDKFSGLEEAQKTYLIDAIKDKIAENPEGFGMIDVDELKVDQKIDFSKALGDESEVNKFFEKANDLSDVDKENILSNNQKIEDWAKENPDGKLDSEQVEEILNSVKETNISDADVRAKTEFEFEGKVDGGEIKTEAQIDSEDFENRMAEDPKAIKDSINTVEREVKAMNNVTGRLTEIGEGHRLFGWGAGQFMKEGGEWDKLKGLKVQEVTKEGFDYYGKGALDKAVNGATQDNLKGLNNYLVEAKELIGGANKGDTLEDYLKRYEVVKQL